MALHSLDDLRAFIAVTDAGSFTSAANRLGLTTNAVSQRVQRLEEAVGVRLLIRTTRSVTLSDEGRIFYAGASKAIVSLDAAEADLHHEEKGLRGTVRIAVPGAVATGPLLARIRNLLEAHPKLKVQTRVTNNFISPAAEGLDIALVVGQLQDSTFVGRLLGRVAWVLAASPSYVKRYGSPRTPAELINHQCLRLLSNPPQEEWTLTDRRGREVTVRVGGSYEADDSRTLGDAVYSGLGIGLRPAGECQRAEKEGRLERVLPGYKFQPLDVYALLPRGRIGIPRVAACLDALRAAVQELS
jgi:DNA-binding transcriptional LysR family regulator